MHRRNFPLAMLAQELMARNVWGYVVYATYVFHLMQACAV